MPNPTSKTKGPLQGLRVLDLTSVLMGPYCTQILADLGADVVKVESKEGDTSRFVGPSKRPGRSGMFTNLNRGKRSVGLDLQTKEGRDLCLRLARTADIFVHSMRPQAMERLGLTYSAVAAINPQIIYCNLYGFGRGGRYAGKPAYDDTIQGVSGLAMLQAEMTDQPQYVTTVVADKISALSAVYSILAGLVHRMRSSEGQEIDVPMFETMVSFLLVEHIAGAVYDPPISAPVYSRAVSPDRRPYKTKTGYLSVLVYNDKQWKRFVELAGRPDLLTNPKFATLADRSRNMAECCQIVAEILLEKSTEEWIDLLDKAEIPVMRLNRTEDLFDDPHLRDVGFFQSVDDPLDGRLRMPAVPISFSRTPGSFTMAAPMLGQHSREVLLELGLNSSDIDALAEQGVIHGASSASQKP